MTVALGLVCSDGVLVASDSMASVFQDNTAAYYQKVKTVPGPDSSQGLAVWVAAGSTYTIEEIEAALKGDERTLAQRQSILTAPDRDLDFLRNAISGEIRNAMKRAYESVLPGVPLEMGAHPFAAGVLFGGVSGGEPYLFEIDHKGALGWHMDTGFHAIGSGGAFATVAMSLMAHYIGEDPVPLEVGKKIAFHAIEVVCDVSAGHVGKPVQMAVADAAGARILAIDEMERISLVVGRWKELERKALLESDSDEPESLPKINE